MASAEGIELSRLRAHRFSDHYVTREGATSRPVSQLSTTDQASESAEAQLAQHPPSVFPGSDYTTQDASDAISSSNDKSPLILPQTAYPPETGEEGEYVQTPTNKRAKFVPWTLRRLSLLGLIAFLTTLIVALEVLHYYSNKNQGLVTADQDATYLWKYLPTAILTILAFYWKKLDYHTKALMPWKLMSEKPQSADQSLLLDYVSANPLVVLSRAIRYGHVPIINATIGSLIVILITVFSTGLFVLQPTSILENTTVSVLNTFDGSRFNASAVDSFPVLVVSSILSGNLSIDYPPGTGVDYAVDTFIVHTALDGPDASKSGNVEIFQADLNCNTGRANLTSLTFDEYHWQIFVNAMDDDCATGSALVAAPGVDYTGRIDTYPIGRVILEQCPGTNQSKLFVVFGQVSVSAPLINNGIGIVHSFNSTVLICTPDHALQEALVTTDFAGTLIDIGVPKTLNRSLISPWDLWSAFNTSLVAAAPTFLEDPDSVDTHGGYSYDNFISALLATWSRQSADYLNPDTLMRDLRQLYTASASQIANRYMKVDSMTVASGSYKTTQTRVTLRGTAFAITEVGLTMLIICTCLVLIFSPCSSSLSTTATLASLAVTIHGTDQLKSELCGSGKLPLSHIRNSLSGKSISLNGHDTNKSNSIQLHKSKAIRPTSSATAAGVITWWIPVAFSMYVKIAVFTLPLAIVACLETTYRISRKGHGLDDAPVNQYWHYAWTWIPASTMTLVSLLYSSVSWSVALLEHYSTLRARSVAAQRVLGQWSLSKPSIQLSYQGLRYKRYALLTAGVSGLLAPLLTIIVSGLILVQPVQKREGLFIALADHVSSPAGQVHYRDNWNQPSLRAANLLYQGYGSYPKGTFKNFVFPNLESDARNATISAGAKLLNASYIDIDVGVIMANVTCQVMDPDGFRYTVGFNGSNDPAGFDYGLWMDGVSGDSWLNLTHVDFASYQCGIADAHCDERTVSLGVDLKANSTRFSAQMFQPMDLQWANLSAWPNGDTLQQAVAARNGTSYFNPNVTLFYGTWHATSARIHGIACYYNIGQGRVNVTYGLSTNNSALVTSVQPFLQDFVPVLNYSQALPWSKDDNEDYQLEVLLPGGDLWQTALNNTPEAFYDTPTGSAQLATQVSDLYSHYFTQFYNIVLRSQNFTVNTTHTNATLVDENWQRMTQSPVSTRILQALLLAMWLCACTIYWLFDVSNLITKNPCSIAAQASLLADSKFLDMIPEGAENATLEELMQMTPFKDHLFSMGWWDDGMGGRRFGIDVGMADFDKGEDDEGKIEESGNGRDEPGFIEDGMAGKVDARVSVDIVGSRV